MKIGEILIERKQQRTMIMYHGTVLKNVRTILKNGLVANPPQRVYDTGEFQTIGGVYLTSAFETAEDAADIASEKFKSPPVVITVQYTLDSGYIDEDILHGIVGDAISYAHKYSKSFSDTIYGYIMRPNNGLKISRDSAPLIQEYAYFVSDLIKTTGSRNIFKLSTNEGYREILTKVLRSVKSADMQTQSEVWVDRDIKFSGKTRIIRITNMNDHTVLYDEKKKNDNTENKYMIVEINDTDFIMDVPEYVEDSYQLEKYFFQIKKKIETMDKKQKVSSYRPTIYTAANKETVKQIFTNNNMSEYDYKLKDGKIYA